MKKTFLAILVAATLVACAKEDVISQNNEAIGFKQAFVDNSVRSVEDPSFSNDNLFASFAVYGTVENAPLFNKVEVSGSELNGTWIYKGTQYWIAGAKYNFAAIAPYAKGVEGAFTVALVGDNYVGTTTLSDYVNDNTDLLYAQNAQVEGKVSGNAKVAFTFKHILSKVKFSFENGYNASTAKIAVRAIKIVNAYTDADVALNLSGATWSGWNGSKTLEFGNATDGTDKVEDADAFAYGTTLESYNEMLLIPTTTKTYNIEFVVNLYVNDVLIKAYPHTATVEFAPEAGKSYNITAVIDAENIDPENKQEPIEFTVTKIDEWATGADQTATIPEGTVQVPGN